ILLNLGVRLFNLRLKTFLVITSIHGVALLAVTLLPPIDKLDSNETALNIEINKSRFLSEQSFNHFMYGGEFYFDFYLRGTNDDLLVKKKFTSDQYPFLHENNYPDVLSPFFDSLKQAPDIVFLFMESFGGAYSGKDAYLGSFTPFLDSLAQHSLVWTNAISSTGRTFGLLPAVFGGLPFGEKGFLELYQEFPYHNSLLSVLGDNGYESRFFIGSDGNFDNETAFLNYQGITQLEDERGFPPTFSKAPSNAGFSWGYSDNDLFRHGISKLPTTVTAPQVRIFQTLTSHDPYLVPERDFYKQKIKNHLSERLRLNATEVKEYMAYENI